MPYKVVGKCVHKLNADGSLGKIVPGGCHESVAEAQAHKRALYANVEKALQEEHEEVPMSNSRVKRQKTREKRKRQHEMAEMRKEEELEDPDELTPEEEAQILAEFEEAETEELDEQENFEKSYDDYAEATQMAMAYGPTSFEELDDARAAEEKAGKIRRASWDVEDLVRNIIHSPMFQGSEKADMIKKVGTDFGERVKSIMDSPADMLKEHSDDAEALEAEAMLAQDERSKNLLEKILSPFQKRDLSYKARESLSDNNFALVYEVDGQKVRKYPIHDKAHVRNALARAAQQIKKGGKGAEDARKALPKIKAAAKRMGIGSDMEKGKSGLIIQKDAKGDWRWVGWPSNNFIDRSKDILTEAAHREYVDWWHKEKPAFPVFTSMHAPGTARTHPVDFVGYENGFLVMSGKLTEDEAVRLMKNIKEYDVGMSHTGWGVRSAEDTRQIVQYRIFEVTDLPLEMADNPFTDLAVMSKEADMLSKEDQIKYLAEIMGSEDLAKEALDAKTAARQSELQKDGIEQKEAKVEAETEAQTPDMAAILEAVSKEFDIEGLNEAFTQMRESVEKVELLEGVIKQQQETIQQLRGDQEEALAERISPVAARFAWSKEKRASQAKATEVEGEELEKLEKNQAGIPQGSDYWLAQQTGFAPIQAEK